MGNVKSFCCKDNPSDEDDREERSCIIDENEDNYTTSSAETEQGSYGNDVNHLEQSALDKIYQKMASSVIDVAPGESIIIQQAEFIERQRIYQMKLGQIKMSLPLRLNNQIPKQVDKGQEKRRVEYEPISSDDKQLISEISTRSARAIRNLKLDSDEQIISQFMA